MIAAGQNPLEVGLAEIVVGGHHALCLVTGVFRRAIAPGHGVRAKRIPIRWLSLP